MTQTAHNKQLNWRLISSFVAALIFAAVLFSAPVHAGKNDGIEGLNEVQQVYAARTLQFIKDMDAKYFGRAADIDGDLVVTTKDFDYDFARYETLVGRGSAIEKIGRMNGIVFEPTGEVQSPTVFGRYYGIDVHPKNPRLGMIHAAFLVQYYPDGKSAVGGTLNVLAGAAPEEDLAAMKAALDEVFEKHGATEHFDEDGFVLKLREMRDSIIKHYELSPSLAEQLAEAIAAEQYELAAELRDRMGH
jgi:hypothetical protein